jgi:hypothetical protein
MADYLPLQITDITERKNEDTGEVRLTAVCRTVQPETINLNLSRLDAERVQRFLSNKGNILMVPIRRGEMNGRSFVSVADGHIFRDSEVVANFTLTDAAKPALHSPSAVVVPDKPRQAS